jgi:hypothetical protein
MTDTTTTTHDADSKLKITLSEQRPIKISKSDWPLIARADRHNGRVECQANHEWTIRVREHADGRRIVYGWIIAGNGGVHAGWRETRAGFVVEPTGQLRDPGNGGALVRTPDDDETIRAIRRVAGAIGDDDMGSECIADLPAIEIA